MRFYWAFISSRAEGRFDHGRLWAPEQDGAGRQHAHWDVLRALDRGDIVVGSYQRKLRFLGVVSRPARRTLWPEWKGRDAKRASPSDWGRQVRLLPHPIEPVPRIDELSVSTRRLLESCPGGPFRRDKYGKRGYVYPLSASAGLALLRELNQEHRLDRRLDLDQAVAADPTASETEREALALARVGQGEFRRKLQLIWDGRCAVTGARSLYRASHIKPWSVSTNPERLDPTNGLLLSPNYDAAFDAGLITFDDDGRIRFSKALAADDARRLGLSRSSKLSSVRRAQLGFLAYHRAHVFQHGAA